MGSHLKATGSQRCGNGSIRPTHTESIWDILEDQKSRPEVKIKALKALLDIHDKMLHLEGVTITEFTRNSRYLR